MTDTELEALAYVLGDSAATELYARLVDMQVEVDALTCEAEDLRVRVAQLERDALCR
jgi:predicted ATP-grasp superfamily ATP-dependent carboligase